MWNMLFQHLAGALWPNIFQHLQHASPDRLQHVFNIWLIEVGTALRPSEMNSDLLGRPSKMIENRFQMAVWKRLWASIAPDADSRA